MELSNVHAPELCAGSPCCIHAPSAHHMADWPQLWRGDRDLMERTCPHGIGHPDPDHMAYVRSLDPDTYAGVHGCDSCCAAPDGQLPGGAFGGLISTLAKSGLARPITTE